MSEQKYAPGPCKVRLHPNDDGILDNPVVYSEDYGDIAIIINNASLHPHKPSVQQSLFEEALANARLISQVWMIPEMVEALRRILSLCHDQNGDMAFCDIETIILDILAKIDEAKS